MGGYFAIGAGVVQNSARHKKNKNSSTQQRLCPNTRKLTQQLPTQQRQGWSDPAVRRASLVDFWRHFGTFWNPWCPWGLVPRQRICHEPPQETPGRHCAVGVDTSRYLQRRFYHQEEDKTLTRRPPQRGSADINIKIYKHKASTNIFLQKHIFFEGFRANG